jgi:hypothetical protein
LDNIYQITTNNNEKSYSAVLKKNFASKRRVLCSAFPIPEPEWQQLIASSCSAAGVQDDPILALNDHAPVAFVCLSSGFNKYYSIQKYYMHDRNRIEMHINKRMKKRIQ